MYKLDVNAGIEPSNVGHPRALCSASAPDHGQGGAVGTTLVTTHGSSAIAPVSSKAQQRKTGKHGAGD
jgi:hypothetical protein